MKLKNLVGAAVALVGITFCGGAFAGGSVWEVLPGTPVGTTNTANERISFRMRLLSPNWDRVPEATDRFGWRIRLTPHGRTLYSNEYLAWAGAPMKLGVVLNGKTVGADWGRYEEGSDELKDSGAFVPAKDNIFQDMHFTYTTRCGDYALPLRLAADEKGTPIGGENGNNYFFINGPGDPTAIWEIVAVSNGYDVADYTFESQASTLGPGSSDIRPPYSYNDLDPDEQGNVRRLLAAGDYLRHNDYLVETLKFDDVKEKTRAGEEYWRVVSEAGDDSGYVVTADEGFKPTVVDTEVYAWIEPDVDRDSAAWTNPANWTTNDYAVTIPSGANVMNAFFRDPDGTERPHRVYRIKLGSTDSYRVPLHGQHRGRTARVVLASTPHYNYLQDGTGAFLLDYRTARVYCDEPAAPTVAVSLADLGVDRTIRYGADGTYADARELKVWLNQATNEDMKVKLTFAWGEGGANTAFPTNVIAISTDPVDGYLTKNLLKDMEVTIPAGETELPEGKKLYLFVLGATSSTENRNEGITITPVPEAKFASFIQTTNAQPFRIIGMNPDIISPLGTEEAPKQVEVTGDKATTFRIELDDSWRNLNLSSNDVAQGGCYEVKWNRYGRTGGSSLLTITNDVNGRPLTPVMDKDGHGWFEISVTYAYLDTNTNAYHSSFVVTNPEGHPSATSYLDVTVKPGPTVEASLPDMPQTTDGFYEAMESDDVKYDVSFQLKPDILEASDMKLYAFLQPADEAASNRTDGAFFTRRADGTAGTGVPIDTTTTGAGSTKRNYRLGGIQILDGDGSGKGDGSTATFDVILCTQETYDPNKVFDVYTGKAALTLLLDNHEPEFKQLVISEVVKGTTTTNDVDVITASGKTAANRVHKGNDVVVGPMTIDDWKDVARDRDATNENLMVTRWLVYRVNDDGAKERWDAYYTYGPDEKLVIPGGLTVYNNKETTYLFEVQIQDKDMRALGTAGLIRDPDEPSGWAYRIYRNLPNFEPDWAGDDEANVWGPTFTFTVLANDKPNVDIVVREQGSTDVQGVRAFTEEQLAPLNNSIYNDGDMRLVVSLAEQFDRKTEVKVKLTLSAADGMDVNGGFVELAETNVYFVGANRTAEVKISDFDATYRDGKVQRGNAKYQVTAEVVDPPAATNKYNATTCQFFVVNRPPRLELGAGSQQFSEYVDNPDLAYDVAKNKELTVNWSATDIHWDLTNISVTATISGGTISDGIVDNYTTYTYAATNSAVVATNYEDGAYNVAFKFKFSTSGTNTITFVATDKDGDSSERHVLRFAIPETKTLLLYPAKPTQPSTDSDDIADYFSAAGIGYGRVWADGDTKLSAIDKWIHDWTCSQGGVAKVYAMGYLANDREDNTSPAFVNVKGSSGSPETDTGYAPADENDKFKYLDSFFYRWFAKLVAESGSDSNWTAYKPVPQVSTNRDTVAAGTVMSMSFPKKTGMNDREYNDISALAIFSRELLWSDNMGDINADGVPDSYVLKYKLVEDYTGGNDLNDVNYTTGGEGNTGTVPNCQDYLPLTDLVKYSDLVKKVLGDETAADNLKNVMAFTPRLKIRGYDETDALSLRKRKTTYGAIAEIIPGVSALNDAADLAGIDGAKPGRKYVNPREDADSTLNYVEWLAWSEFKAANPAATEKDWSPERPTDPTKADFDNDGFTDGYEYYVWYRAHVGWVEIDASGKEIHRYLTGRAYDPRNPGEGKFISSERIAELFDPRTKGAADNTQDTDNDGLPDILEFEIGTSPFDFDSDGDGLPDGWELCYTSNLDPTDPISLSDGKNDAERNYDGDAMAFTTVALEENVLPKPRFIQRYNTFATVDAGGDTDGVQWYAETPLDGGVSAFAFAFDEAATSGTVFRIGGVDYVTTRPFAVTADNRLAVTLAEDTYAVTNASEAAAALALEAPEGVKYVRLRPAKFVAGAVVETNEANVAFAVARVATNAAPEKCNAAWPYGNANVLSGKFGMLALARYQLPEEGDAVAELPTMKRDVAYLHYLVYQQFGFDPRTAWNENTPLAARWGKTDDVDSSAGQVSKKGYADQSTRTRAYTAYDEFLLYSFFLNNGCDMGGYLAKSATAKEIINLWGAFTTNPQGPAEPAPKKGTRADVAGVEYLARGTNGADTDEDGVPDGWELYIMAGPKIGKDGKADPKDGKFNFAPAYAAFTAAGEEVIEMPQSYFSPFVKAATLGTTDNMAYIGKNQNDSLNEYLEFAGTDSCGYYEKAQSANTEPYSTTVKLPEDWTWLNKFFPTDPWVPDTDDDGVKDNEEGGVFAYAKDEVPEDDGKSICFAGCGLNPCSVDTDGDGIPDGWEKQFAGSTVSTNVVEGYIDGMDGTVKDAVTNPQKGPNRDYDHDGLENWQEYLTGTMRCWRYDDPFTQWGAIPFDAYFIVNSETGAVSFSPKFEALFGYFPEEERKTLRSMDEEKRWNWFWYQTLVNVGGPIYNPHLVTDQSPTAQYFSRVDVGWDPNYWDMVLSGEDDPDKPRCGKYYWFAHRIGRTKYKEAWSRFYGSDYDSKLYVSCSPRSEDSDHDGMDDFYELFHGLNPLLGGDGMTAFEDPADIVKCIKGADRSGPVSFNYNPWVSPWPVGLMMQPPMRPAREVCDNPDFDFIVHPWKNGLQTADPDGDNERNYVEAILAKTVFGMHTDPSPAWMTDASYADSLTRLCYRVPRVNYFIPFKFGMVNDQVTDQNGDSVPGFTYNDVKYYFRDFDAYDMKSEGKMIEYFTPDAWAVNGDLLDARTPEYLLTSDRMILGGWMFSFEENEGYDTDHDAMGDEEEIAGRIRSATDPLDFDSPRRRQAMYFPGKDSALQTPPELIEEHPIAGAWYKQDPSFAHYTVECWVRPEEIRDATVVERAIWSDGSNGGDANLVRKNFLIGTRVGEDGKCYWFTKFDSNGTGSEKKDEVSVRSGTPAEIGVWTHVAATYDGEHIVLYVNGQQSGTPADPWKTEPLPECAVAEVLTFRGQPVAGQLETINRYSHHALVVGASVRSYDDYDVGFTDQVCGYAVNLYNAMGWSYYKDFFKGYVDEIRIWDGARTQADIQGSMRTRFDSEKAKENRSAIYKELNLRNWTGRYEKGEDGTVEEMPAELRYHFSFDALPSAANAGHLAVTPQGFADGDKAPVSRPEGYEIAWWKRILDSYGSAYAGAANFVNWIPNTVAHLPRFDGTTYDSAFWSDDYKGDLAEINRFAHTAEPYPLWTQVTIGRYTGELRSTLARWYLANVAGTNSDLSAMFDFTGRHLLCEGADLLPLGGAYARYVDTMWDGQGASSMRELTGEDNDNDGLPDWWQVYANQNYHKGVPEGEDISWDTLIWYEVGGVEIRITAAEAYKRDLAKGAYVDEYDVVHPTSDEREAGTVLPYVQTAKSDNMIPDWWKELKKIDSEEPLADLDRDGLNNYVEYVASELLPFRLNLDPRMAFSDSKTLDYFRKVGRLYLGEMLTDHDQMEDHWERSLGDENVASAAIWDALKDGEEDGWNNFAENRYNGYSMSTLAQLVAHAMGDNEVLDAPIPSIKMKVRYDNADRSLDAEKDDARPPIVVRAYSKNAITGDYAMDPDATWTVTPGVETEERSFYLGAWEDRIVRGTLAPGNVNLDSVDIKFAQVPQNDLYSWSDESGLHLAKSYKEFKEAFDKNPNIIQNIQSFKWLSLVAPANEYTSSDKAVTVGRDQQSQQNALIAVYGEPVGTIDLTTGDFEFDLGAMNKLRVNYTFDGSKGLAAAWSYKEAIFKITYTAKVPSTQQKVVDFSLAKADRGFVCGGLNSIEVFYDSVNVNGTWDPGEPFGVVNDVEIGWAGRNVEIELTDMSAITPRVKLWGASSGDASSGGNGGGQSGGSGEKDAATASASDSDRGTRVGVETFSDVSNRFEISTAPAPKSRVRVVRYKVDKFPVYKVGVKAGVVLEKDFEETSRDFLHEGDFLADGDLDIDWENLYTDVVGWRGALDAACQVTNVIYLIVYNWDAASYATDDDTNTQVKANATLVTRRFEKTRSVPTIPDAESAQPMVYNQSHPTFSWRIDNEDKWASWFGTTYTAFKVRVKDESGTLIYDSGIRRLPAKDSKGVYTWTAPLSVGTPVPGSDVIFRNLENYTWEVAVYNAKFRTDDLMTIQNKKLVTGNPFSAPRQFRMNVTALDTSSEALAVRVCYTGPAANLANRLRVQAFASPDFTGDPIAETVIRYLDTDATAQKVDSLSPVGADANAEICGLPAGSYFIRAYIDTNGNGVRDEWESWGYLNERDLASKPGIFNPVTLATALNPSETNVRKVFIEDCDTNRNWFPDVWEAEQNGGEFDSGKFAPVKGDAELIGVNPELKDVLGMSDFPMLEALRSKAGLALISGVPPTRIKTVERSDGTLGIAIDNQVESVRVTGFDFTADGGVEITIDAATTTGEVDESLAALYALAQSGEMDVTCNIYRKEKLSDKSWTKAGSSTVRVGGGPVKVTVSGGKAAQGYFKAEIIEK